MSREEIKQKIDELNKQIEESIDPTTFVLNEKTAELQREITELQSQCDHEFEKQVCKWCGHIKTILIFATEAEKTQAIVELLKEKELNYFVETNQMIIKHFLIEDTCLQIDGGDLLFDIDIIKQKIGEIA